VQQEGVEVVGALVWEALKRKVWNVQLYTEHRAPATQQNYDSFLIVVSVIELERQMGNMVRTFRSQVKHQKPELNRAVF